METDEERVESPHTSEFNRIYEEWKPATILSIKLSILRSIESMRNGNTDTPSVRLSKAIVQSNLWGMETRKQQIE